MGRTQRHGPPEHEHLPHIYEVACSSRASSDDSSWNSSRDIRIPARAHVHHVCACACFLVLEKRTDTSVELLQPLVFARAHMRHKAVCTCVLVLDIAVATVLRPSE
jgi:hypothetical protein